MALSQPAASSCERCGAQLARDNSDTECSSCRRGSALKPPIVPREFWNTRDMRSALDSWHMGRVILAYRTHPWHGRQLSQDVVGGWLDMTQPQLSRIESGRVIEDLGARPVGASPGHSPRTAVVQAARPRPESGKSCGPLLSAGPLSAAAATPTGATALALPPVLHHASKAGSGGRGLDDRRGIG